MLKNILSSRITSCAAAVIILSGCQNVPKYKKTGGKFDEWKTYEGKHFSPSTGVVAAVDPATNSVTIAHGKGTRVLTVTSDTRIMHEGTDIALAQLPLNQSVKYTLSNDGKQLLTIWYGQGVAPAHHPVVKAKEKNTFF